MWWIFPVDAAAILVRQLRIAVWAAGVAAASDLGPGNLLHDGQLRPPLHE